MDSLNKIMNEYKSRTIFGNPIRWTTLQFHRDKVTFKEFVDSLGHQEEYFQGEKYPEEWCELWMAYNEIEEKRDSDDETTEYTIICLAEQEDEYRKIAEND